MRCPQCDQDNPANARFCNGCGARLEAECPSCHHVNPFAAAGTRGYFFWQPFMHMSYSVLQVFPA